MQGFENTASHFNDESIFMSSTQKIAVLAGDGIGKEVMPEGLRVLQAAAGRFGLPLEFHHFDWAHCD